MRVGVSYVDPAGAQKNLDAEQPDGTSFDSVATKAHDAWNTQLNRIEIDGGTAAQQKIFYTALYHSLLHMNVYQRRRRPLPRHGPARRTRSSPASGAQYATFSGWDIYRSQVQLVSLPGPERRERHGAVAAQPVHAGRRTAAGTAGRTTPAPSRSCPATRRPRSSTPWPRSAAPTGTAQAALQSLVKAATVPTRRGPEPRRLDEHGQGPAPVAGPVPALRLLPEPVQRVERGERDARGPTADFAIADLAKRLGDIDHHAQFMPARSAGRASSTSPRSRDDRLHAEPRRRRHVAGDRQGRRPRLRRGQPAQYVWNVPFDVAGLFAAMGGPPGLSASTRTSTTAPTGPSPARAARIRSSTTSRRCGRRGCSPGRASRPRRRGRPPGPGHAVDDRDPRHPRQRRPRDDVVLVRLRRHGHVPDDPGPRRDDPRQPDIHEGRRPPSERPDADDQRARAAAASRTSPRSSSTARRTTSRGWRRASSPATNARLRPDRRATRGDNAPLPPSFRGGEQPAIAALDPSNLQLDPGGKAHATLTLQNTTTAPLTVTLNNTPAEHISLTADPIVLPRAPAPRPTSRSAPTRARRRAGRRRSTSA